MYSIGLKRAARSNITRAPREGRKKNGGMRIGEMECEELVSAG